MTDENNRNDEIDKKEDAENIEKEEFNFEDEQVMDLPMIPLRGLSVFPNMVLHFDIGREKSINALEKAMIMNQYIFLAAQKDENTDLPTPEDFYHIGTIGKIKQMLKLPGDSIRVLVEGICRGRIDEILFEVPYFKCTVTKLEDDEPEELTPKTEALMRSILNNFDEYLAVNQKLAPEILPTVAGIEEPGRFADPIWILKLKKSRLCWKPWILISAWRF